MLGKLTDAQIDDLLMSESVGRIGCHSEGKTRIAPISFAFDGMRIIGHSTLGEKVWMMRENPSVCFEVEKIKDLRNWQTVVIQGHYRELKSMEASAAIGFLVEKLLPELPSESAHLSGKSIMPQKPGLHNAETVIFCIEIVEKSGRFEQAQP